MSGDIFSAQEPVERRAFVCGFSYDGDAEANAYEDEGRLTSNVQYAILKDG